MIKIENTKVEGWEPAIRGMRNAFNSWSNSDSGFWHVDGYYDILGEHAGEGDGVADHFLGPVDKTLMRTLVSAGSDHGKYRRMITVWFDLTAPLYFWKEFDTYKVGTVANSCSTMHKIAAKEFDMGDFSFEHLFDQQDDEYACFTDLPFAEKDLGICPKMLMWELIKMLNKYRELYLETKDKRYWWQMIQLLPSSYNQRRTVMLNYEVLANIYHARRNHKLDEWHTFCDWIEMLPESWIIIGKSEDDRVNELYSSHVMLSREFCFPTSNEKAEANTKNLVDDGK